MEFNFSFHCIDSIESWVSFSLRGWLCDRGSPFFEWPFECIIKLIKFIFNPADLKFLTKFIIILSQKIVFDDNIWINWFISVMIYSFVNLVLLSCLLMVSITLVFNLEKKNWIQLGDSFSFWVSFLTRSKWAINWSRTNLNRLIWFLLSFSSFL